MPKINVAKLEKKFQTLSRSKESIQGVAVWIMNHKDVYQEIVDQWLIGVSKKVNTLLMFYVANEVIQGCGKKKCPEFRQAFSGVLEKAASFENVQEIKKDVIRLLTLWKERKIYDDEFNQRIEAKLNASAVLEESSEEDEEKELSEMEIIEQFKKQTLIERLEKLKVLENQIKEKEDILNYADVPEMPDIEDMIIRRNCQDMMKKCDKYIALVKECSDLAHKEISLRKKILKEMKNTSVFYTAQQRDVKKVYNAFRMYGKRMNLMETKLSEKISTLPSFDSPCFSEENTATSPSNFFSPSLSPNDTDVSKSSLSPLNEPSQSSKKSKPSFALLGRVLQESVSGESFNIVKQPPESKPIDVSTLTQLPNLELAKVLELVADSQTEKPSILNKQITLNEPSTQEIKDSNTLSVETSNNRKKDVPTKGTGVMEEENSLIEKEAIKISDTKSFSKFDLKSQSDKIKDHSIHNKSLKPDEKDVDKGTAERNIAEQIQQPTKSQDAEDVDYLLEESYGSKKTKTTLSYKRKIEFLLKSKGKKPCIEPGSEDSHETEQIKKDSPVLNTVDIKNKNDDENVKDTEDSKETEANKKGNSNNEKAESQESTDSKMNLFESASHVKHSSDVPNAFSDSDLCDKDELKSEESSFDVSGTFTGTALSSFMGMSTDFLKNILQSNQENSQKESQDDDQQLPMPEVDISLVKNSPDISTDLPKEDSNHCDEDLLPNSEDVSQTSSNTTTTLTKDTNVLSPNLSFTGSVNSQVSNTTEEPKPSKEEISSEKDKFVKTDKPDLFTESSNSDLLLCTKTTLLETLKNVLKCLSENMSSGRDFNNYLSEKYPELDPPLSFESCLKLYEYIHDTVKTENSINLTESSYNSPKCNVTPVVPPVKDNYQVMDMECDSEDDS